MDAQTNLLLAAFERAREPEPADLLSAIRGLPAGALPSPWETWTLIGLVRHPDDSSWPRLPPAPRLGRGPGPRRRHQGVLPRLGEPGQPVVARRAVRRLACGPRGGGRTSRPDRDHRATRRSLPRDSTAEV